MTPRKLGLIGLILILLVAYNGAQPDLLAMRTNPHLKPGTKRPERYGPSLVWLDRLMKSSAEGGSYVKLDFNVMSSMMVAGLASGFKSQVANLLWMKSDEYWHKGMLTRQVPLMELVVTLDPQFIDAWSTAGWHWAYNIYADIELNPLYKDHKNDPQIRKIIRQKQDKAVVIGMDYLSRGAEMNPDTYRLWFEYAWHRQAKQGILDDKTVELLWKAHQQSDARTMLKDEVVDGKKIQVPVQGIDLVGRTIGHVYEKIPEIDKALDQYAKLLVATPHERAMLDAIGDYWHRYGSDYTVIASQYASGDSTMKARIKALVPDVDRMVQAQAMREVMSLRDSQPTGAYITISARYVPAWKLYKQGKIQEAINNIVGVMNANPQYHLKDLKVLGRVYELRGDAPIAVAKELDNQRDMERRSSEDIGLHMMGKLYEKLGRMQTDPRKKLAYMRLAYESWYRSRERNNLDFYARHNTSVLEDEFNFQPPQAIIKAVKESRKHGDPKAAPEAPPSTPDNVGPATEGEHVLPPQLQ